MFQVSDQYSKNKNKFKMDAQKPAFLDLGVGWKGEKVSAVDSLT